MHIMISGISAHRVCMKITTSFVSHFFYVWVVVLYKGKYSSTFYIRPFRPCCQRANVSLGEFQCFKLFLFKHSGSGQIKDVAKLFAIVAKTTRDKNNPVYYIHFVSETQFICNVIIFVTLFRNIVCEISVFVCIDQFRIYRYNELISSPVKTIITTSFTTSLYTFTCKT